MAHQGNAEGSLPIPGVPYTPYVPQREAIPLRNGEPMICGGCGSCRQYCHWITCPLLRADVERLGMYIPRTAAEIWGEL
jgi:hypothetical protein